jgi:hypothetical protein
MIIWTLIMFSHPSLPGINPLPVGNLKKLKNCLVPEISLFCRQKFRQMPSKTGISFGSLILELKRIPGWEFEIYLKSSWFSGILNQM